MSMLHRSRLATLTLVGLSFACSNSNEPVPAHQGDPEPGQTPSFAVGPVPMSTLLGRATFSDPKDRVFKVKRMTDNWHLEIKSTPAQIGRAHV